MNDIESRLTDAMAARARDVEPHDEDDALKRISERVNMSHRRGLTVLGIAAALMVAVGAVALLNRDDKGGQNLTVSSGPISTPSTTQNTTTPTIVPSFEETAIWPLASMNRTFATPEEAAKSFAVDYLGMTHARLGATKDENGTKNVEIFPNDRGTARTVVRVVEQRPRGWVVFEARADEIQVESPARNAPLTSPLVISGQSTAFEATVGLQLRRLDAADPVFTSNFMGGSNGQMGPFSTSITPPSTDQPLVLVLFEGDASGEQTFTKATVLTLAAAGTPQPATFIGQATNGDLTLLDFAGHVQQPSSAQDKAALENAATLPSNVSGTLPTRRGRFGTIAFFDGSQISSYNPSNGNVAQLVQPAAAPISLDADESGRYLLWVDVNHDLWKWSGGDAVKIGTGFNSAAW
jgi:hypothetical protein